MHQYLITFTIEINLLFMYDSKTSLDTKRDLFQLHNDCHYVVETETHDISVQALHN